MMQTRRLPRRTVQIAALLTLAAFLSTSTKPLLASESESTLSAAATVNAEDEEGWDTVLATNVMQGAVAGAFYGTLAGGIGFLEGYALGAFAGLAVGLVELAFSAASTGSGDDNFVVPPTQFPSTALD